MPILQNPRHEKFAQARAMGTRLLDAYEDAGFVPDRSHAGRLGRQPDVTERIAELRASQEDAAPRTMIATLLRLAKASEDLGTPAGVKEARATLLEARRLIVQVTNERHSDRFENPYGY
jgi:hypothetical protein